MTDLREAGADTLRAAPLLAEEVHRAIWLDFEGTEKDPPTLVGILRPAQEEVEQVVFEALFESAGAARGCSLGELSSTLAGVAQEAMQEDSVIASWSRHELDVAEHALGGDALSDFHDRFRNAKALAKVWAMRCRPDVAFPRDPRNGRYQLVRFFPLFGYEVHPAWGTGHTGERIRYLRTMLEKKNGDFDVLPPGSKRKWTNLLRHNQHDCLGMRDVCFLVAGDLASGCSKTRRGAGQDMPGSAGR